MSFGGEGEVGSSAGAGLGLDFLSMQEGGDCVLQPAVGRLEMCTKLRVLPKDDSSSAVVSPLSEAADAGGSSVTG